jgi:serine/threonine-protein kinase
MDAAGAVALVADYANSVIRYINVSSGTVSTLAGCVGRTGWTIGVGTQASFNFPVGVALDAKGSLALVADGGNLIIRSIIMSSGFVNIIAGTALVRGFADGIGTSASFYWPTGIALDATGTYAVVTDYNNQLIRLVVVSTSLVTTLAGVPLVGGSSNGIGSAAFFERPMGVSLDAAGITAFIADSSNHQIRAIGLSPFPSSSASPSPTRTTKSAEPSLSPESMAAVAVAAFTVLVALAAAFW